MKYVYLALLLVLNFGCSEKLSELEAVVDNNAGVIELTREKDREALERFVEAMAHEPFNSSIQMNLGLAYEILEDYDRAFQSYGLVLEAEDQSVEAQFQALFNMARVEGARKNIGSALQHYQRALKINPKSQEVKHNIELLLSEGGGQGEGDGESGGGEGSENEDPKEGGDKPQEPKQNDQEQPRPEELKPEDVRQILEELSRQEKKIRAKEMEQKGGEPQDGKNW